MHIPTTLHGGDLNLMRELALFVLRLNLLCIFDLLFSSDKLDQPTSNGGFLKLSSPYVLTIFVLDLVYVIYLGVDFGRPAQPAFCVLIGTGRNGSFAFLADWIRKVSVSVSVQTESHW